MDDYLSKPITLQNLLDMIKVHIARSHAAARDTNE